MTTSRAVVAACLLVAACHGDDPISPEERYGTYELQTIDGQGVPASVNVRLEDGETITSVFSGQLRLLEDNSHSIQVMVPSGFGGTQVPYTFGSARARYGRNTVSMPLYDGRTVTGTFSGTNGSTVTVPLGQPWGTLVFRRLSVPGCRDLC